MRVIIVDDEPLARDRLRSLLAKESDVQVVAECGDGRLLRLLAVEFEGSAPSTLATGDQFNAFFGTPLPLS